MPQSEDLALVEGAQGALTSTDNPLAAFVAHLAAEDVAEQTARTYLAHVARFAQWLHEQYQATLFEATGVDLRHYRDYLAARQSPNSVNLSLAALKRFYRWAAEAGHIAADPTAKVRPVEAQPLAPQGFTPLERRRLEREAERAGPMPNAIVLTLLHTGLRVGELVALRWEDVELNPRSGWARVVGKRRKWRRVPLNLTVREALTAIRPDPAVGPVFRGRRGPYTARGIRQLLAALGRRAGVADVHPHRFRHTVARQLVERGVDLPTVATLLGHARLDTVRVYSTPDAAALERAAATMEQG